MSDPIRPGRPDAAAAIWRWQDGAMMDAARRVRAARRGALIRFVVASSAGALFFLLHRPIAAAAAGALGVLGLALAIASPLGAYAALERAVATLGRLIGTLLTWLLLAPVFYLFFTPFGLLFRRGRRDPMKRALEPDAKTYWQRRDDDRPNLERPF